ncbi:hypothetical protein DXG03_002330, partial [Asterophora parasitica]
SHLIPDFIHLTLWGPSPINRLPVELVMEIFVFSLRDFAGDPGLISTRASRKFRDRLSLSPGASSDPMILAQVCRRWRYIALSMPRLWTKMRIKSYSHSHHVPLVQTWLQRSANLPLDISLHELNRSEKTLPITVGILSLLIGQAHRWKSIDFSFSHGVPWVLLNTLESSSLRILESAEIMSCDDDFLDFVEAILPSLEKTWSIIHGAPSLHKGKWELHYLYHRLWDVPWNQLTSIDISVSIGTLLDLLPSYYSEQSEAYLLQTLASPAFQSVDNLSVNSTLSPMTGLVPFLTIRDGHIALPRLQKLDIAKCEAPPGAYLQMVRSRQSRGGNSSTLRDVRIPIHGRDQDERNGFKELAAEGMLVQFR